MLGISEVEHHSFIQQICDERPPALFHALGNSTGRQSACPQAAYTQCRDRK